MSSPAAAPSIIYLGMDVHQDSVTIAVLPATASGPTRLGRLPNDSPKLDRFSTASPARASSASATKRAAPGTWCTARCARGVYLRRDGHQMRCGGAAAATAA